MNQGQGHWATRHRLAGCGYCERCGRLMVMVKLRDGLIADNPLDRLGWECLICGQVVDLRGIARSRETPAPDMTNPGPAYPVALELAGRMAALESRG